MQKMLLNDWVETAQDSLSTSIIQEYFNNSNNLDLAYSNISRLIFSWKYSEYEISNILEKSKDKIRKDYRKSNSLTANANFNKVINFILEIELNYKKIKKTEKSLEDFINNAHKKHKRKSDEEKNIFFSLLAKKICLDKKSIYNIQEIFAKKHFWDSNKIYHHIKEYILKNIWELNIPNQNEWEYGFYEKREKNKIVYSWYNFLDNLLNFANQKWANTSEILWLFSKHYDLFWTDYWWFSYFDRLFESTNNTDNKKAMINLLFDKIDSWVENCNKDTNNHYNKSQLKKYLIVLINIIKKQNWSNEYDTTNKLNNTIKITWVLSIKDILKIYKDDQWVLFSKWKAYEKKALDKTLLRLITKSVKDKENVDSSLEIYDNISNKWYSKMRDYIKFKFKNILENPKSESITKTKADLYESLQTQNSKWIFEKYFK